MDKIERELELFRRLLEFGHHDEIEPLLREALALAVEVVGAERGYLELRDDARSDEEVWSMAIGCEAHEVHNIRGTISRGVIAEALATGRTVATDSAMLDERFNVRESVRRAKIEAVLCAPLGEGNVAGVVYLQGRHEPGPFSKSDQETAELFARNLVPVAERLLALDRVRDLEDATRSLRESFRLEGVVGRSRSLATALEDAMHAASLNVTVLLTGASGTGKSHLARAIHDNSRRAAGPFIDLNCAALPADLIESELFGAKAGSHSTAQRDRVGRVGAAEGGTLFLDEIAELPVSAQSKLLQLLHSKEYFPIGAPTPQRADVRLIAATNAELEARIADGRFREDLFYRLNVVPVRVPSLAERREDIRELALALCERIAARHDLPDLRLSRAALAAIEAAEWPGNVRQLENALEAGIVRAAGRGVAELAPSHVFPNLAPGETPAAAGETYQEALRRFQRELVQHTLDETDWNVSETARRLDVARSHVYSWIKSFALRRDSRG